MLCVLPVGVSGCFSVRQPLAYCKSTAKALSINGIMVYLLQRASEGRTERLFSVG